MKDFLTHLGEIEAREAYSRQRLLDDDPAFATTVSAVLAAQRNQTRFQEARYRCAKLIDDVRSGLVSDFVLKEAMSTSDFPILFGTILDGMMLGSYAEWPQTWQTIARGATLRDFRNVKRTSLSGADGVLQRVHEHEEYPQATLSASQLDYGLQKYGRRMDFSWEMIINDDMGALNDIPARFGRAARRSEDFFVTALYVGANGPKATVYTAPNGNIVTGNPALSVTALQTALTLLSGRVDSEGQPVFVDVVELVVPPALEIVANNILNATQLEIGASTDSMRMVTANWLKNRMRVTVNPYIPIIATTANSATSWFLFAGTNTGRPALEFGRLRGQEQPQMFMKSPNAVPISGNGAVSAMQGDFDTDSLAYKVRHCFGGGVLEARSTVASNGSGV